jgi:hypothetical protein
MTQVASVEVFRRRASHSVAGQRGALLCALLIIAVFVCAIGSLTAGAISLALTSAATLLVAWIVFQVGSALLPTSLCFRLLVCVYAGQSLAQLLLALFGQTRSPTGGWGMDLADHSGVLALGEWSLLAGTLLAATMWGLLTHRTRRPSLNLTQHSTTRTRFVLIAALFLHISRLLLALALPASLVWVSNLLTEDLEAVGFFVGWFAGDLGAAANAVVLSALAMNCVVGALLGTRYPTVLLGLYVAGRLVSPHERHRRRLIFASLAALVPLFLLFSLVGDVRVRRGRNSLDLLGISQLSGFADEIAVSRSDYQARDTDPIANTLNRLYAWPNAASTVLTPDPIPYRGFAAWASDCRPYLQIGTWGADGRQRFFASGFGTQHASDYGFMNVIGSTSEFGVLADGWSTAGPVGVLVLGFLVVMALCMSEYVVLYSVGLSYTGKLVFLCILMKACLHCNGYPTPLVIRYILLYTVFWALILKILDALSGYNPGTVRKHSRHSMARMGKPTSGE